MQASVPGLPSGRRGTTLIEIMVVLSVMLVAVSIFYQMVLSTKRLRTVNHENAVAFGAARSIVERMRNEDFADVYRIYNADPSDDPGAPGSAPGNRFPVEGLPPLSSAADGMVGEVMFPSVAVKTKPAGGSPGVVGFGALQAQAIPEWQLREDFADAELGMPRDLNGDSIIDDLDHGDDYLILPVRVRLEWEGVFGSRSVELYTMLGEFKKP